MTTTTTTPSGPLDPVGADLMRTLRSLKLGRLKDTLPEWLALARQHKMGHAAFLELLLDDEVTRRESRSAIMRARTAGLDPTMRLDTWDEPDDLTYDRTLLSDLTSLRFAEAGHGVLILGPVGVGKTHLATALGHIGIRRRISVHASRTNKLFTRLRAARLDNTLEAEMRKLARVDLLILALRALYATETNDFYELVVERHRKAATVLTSNREPSEWMSMMSDALLAQSAIDRLLGIAEVPPDRMPSDLRPDGRRLVGRDLRFAYRQDHDVLHGIDLDLGIGERLAVVGPSGSGKSTLGRLLSGINRPRIGSATAGGADLVDLPMEVLRTEVALVTQEHHVFIGTLRDNIVLAREDSPDEALWAALAAVGSRDWVERLPHRLDTRIGSGPTAADAGAGTADRARPADHRRPSHSGAGRGHLADRPAHRALAGGVDERPPRRTHRRGHCAPPPYGPRRRPDCHWSSTAGSPSLAATTS